MRRKVRTRTCLGCDTTFSCIQRVFRHVAYVSEKCKQFYITNIPDMSDLEYDAIVNLDYYDDKLKKSARGLVCPAHKM